MFFHNFKYTLKVLFKNKGLLFWTFAFPIIMATLFNMAFGNWVESEKFDPIDIAIINNSYYEKNTLAKTIFDSISKKDENQVFEIVYTTKEEASELLNDKKITGYIEYTSDNSNIVINSNSVSSTIIKTVVDEIDTYSAMFNDLIRYESNKTSNMNEIINDVINKITNIQIKTKDVSLKKFDIVIIEYYSLISMACLYGGFISLTCISNSLATSSKKGKRVEVAPTKKSITIFSSLLAGFIAQMLGVLLLLGYIKLIGINLYVDNIKLLIISTLGVLSGISLGLIISTISNKNDDTKLGIIIAISMACCVMAGMTGVSLKHVIDTKLPLLNKINPAAMLTDGLYSLYYNDFNRYLTNIFSLLLFVIVLVLISICSLRRKKYDNI